MGRCERCALRFDFHISYQTNKPHTSSTTQHKNQVTGHSHFIKREPARQAMAHLRYLAQTHSYHQIALVLNALYPPPAVRAPILFPLSSDRRPYRRALDPRTPLSPLKPNKNAGPHRAVRPRSHPRQAPPRRPAPPHRAGQRLARPPPPGAFAFGPLPNSLLPLPWLIYNDPQPSLPHRTLVRPSLSLLLVGSNETTTT